jgi:monoterpene epsilon-lactone hydrolase
MQDLGTRLWDARVSPGEPIARHRAAFEQMSETFRVADGVDVAPIELGGVPAERVTAPGVASAARCLYLHGGGYVIGSLRTHRELASRYSSALGMPTVLVDYRLAPEHPAPAALADATRAYLALLDSGTSADDVVLCGESAGGGLCLALLAHLRDASAPLPACVALVSPWLDLTLSGESYTANADTDPLVVREVIEEYVSWYAGDRRADDPLVSPVLARLDGLPPTLVLASASEMLADDARLLRRRLQEAGVPVELDLYPGAVHAWTLFPHLPESGTALRRIADFALPRVRSRA